VIGFKHSPAVLPQPLKPGVDLLLPLDSLRGQALAASLGRLTGSQVQHFHLD
jgi:hypothetical protein